MNVSMIVSMMFGRIFVVNSVVIDMLVMEVIVIRMIEGGMVLFMVFDVVNSEINLLFFMLCLCIFGNSIGVIVVMLVVLELEMLEISSMVLSIM